MLKRALTKSSSHFERACVGAAIAFVSTIIVVNIYFLVYAIHGLQIKWPTSYAEGTVVAAISRLINNEELYVDFNYFPYLLTYYPPLFYILNAIVSKISNVDAYGTYVVGRLISLFSSIALTIFVFSLARASGVNRLAAAAGAGLLLPSVVLERWAISARPDTLAAACCLLAAVILLRHPNRIAASAAVAAAATLIKQTAIVFPMAAFIWLFLAKRYQAAFVFAVTYGLLIATPTVVLDLVTHGNYTLNVFISNLNPSLELWDAWGRRSTVLLSRGEWFPVMLAMVGLLSVMRGRFENGKFLSLYLFLALAFALYTLRGKGSDVNHLIESFSIICVLASMGVQILWRERYATGAAFGLFVAVFMWGTVKIDYFRSGGSILLNIAPTDYWLYGYGALTGSPTEFEEVAGASRILAEEPTIVLLAGKSVVVSDAYHLSMMTSTGRWSPKGLEALVRECYFDLVIMGGDSHLPRFWVPDQPMWPELVREAVVERYAFRRQSGPYWFYVPKRCDGGVPGGVRDRAAPEIH